MKNYWIIIANTWRQSRSQIVLLVAAAAFAIVALAAVIMPQVYETETGETYLGVIWSDNPDASFDGWFRGLYIRYASAELGAGEQLYQKRKEFNAHYHATQQTKTEYEAMAASGAPVAELRAAQQAALDAQKRFNVASEELRQLRLSLRQAARDLADGRTAHMGRVEKGVSAWLNYFVQIMFMLSMSFFIAVAAGYYPDMIRSDAVDLLVSKPIGRHHLFFGKFIGGLALFSALLIATYLFVFVGVGLRTGIWHFAFFGALPVTIFSLSLLYSVIAWIGVRVRSAPLSILLGYVFFLVVDTAVNILSGITDQKWLEELSFLQPAAEAAKYGFPNFSWLRNVAEATTFDVLVFEWQPLLTGAIWLVFCLGVAYNVFRKADY